MSIFRTIFPKLILESDPDIREWRAAVMEAHKALAAKKGWTLRADYTDVTFAEPPAQPQHSNVTDMPSFRRAREFLHPIIGPQGDGPRTAA